MIPLTGVQGTPQKWPPLGPKNLAVIIKFIYYIDRVAVKRSSTIYYGFCGIRTRNKRLDSVYIIMMSES